MRFVLATLLIGVAGMQKRRRGFEVVHILGQLGWF